MSIEVVAPEELDKRLANAVGHVFLRFKSHQCVHCNNMTDSWNEVAIKVPEDVIVIDVDVTNGLGGSTHECTKRFKDAGGAIPRMYLINKDKINEYDGDRNTDAFMSAMNNFIKDTQNNSVLRIEDYKKSMPSNSKRTNSKRTNSKRTNSKRTNSKRSNSKRSNSKRFN